jgi:hypothetical protein
VHEHLELDVGGRADAPQVGERKLAPQHHPAGAVGGGEGDALGTGDGHLGGAVDRQAGRDLARKARHADVLHDHRVHARLGDRRERAFGGVEFVVEDQGVEGDEAADAALVQRRHRLGEFLEGEADLGAGAEVVEAEVDRVGAGLDRSPQLRPVAGGAHQFGGAGAARHRRRIVARGRPAMALRNAGWRSCLSPRSRERSGMRRSAEAMPSRRAHRSRSRRRRSE